MEMNGVEGWKYLLLVASSTKLVNHWLVTKKIVFCKTEKANDMKYYLVRLCFSKWELFKEHNKQMPKKQQQQQQRKFSFLWIWWKKAKNKLHNKTEKGGKKSWKEGKNVETFLYFFFLSCDKKSEGKTIPQKSSEKEK